MQLVQTGRWVSTSASFYVAMLYLIAKENHRAVILTMCRFANGTRGFRTDTESRIWGSSNHPSVSLSLRDF